MKKQFNNVGIESLSQRWVFAVMCFFGLAHSFAMRTCFSIALTEMVRLNKSSSNHDDSCPSGDVSDDISNNISESPTKIFHWAEETQGLILSSFYWGNVIGHLPGGIVADKYGGKHIYGLGVFVSAVFTLLTPQLLVWSEYGLILSRVVIGFAQGAVYPAINVLLSAWAPAQERSRMGTVVYAGASVGMIYAYGISGFILKYTSGDTSTVFYFFGGLACLWYLLWLMLCYNQPSEHPFISESELDYISKHTTCVNAHREDIPALPWRRVLKSKPVWAVTLALLGFDWLTLTLISDLPKYLGSVLKFQVQINGYVNSLLYFGMWLSSIVTSWMTDLAIEGGKLSRTNVRKIGSVLALFVPACFVTGASYVGCDHLLVIVMFTVAMMFSGASYPSVMVNTLDLSPNYSGILMAVVNAVSSGIAGILSPYIIGILTPHQTMTEWRIVFWILFAVSSVTNLVFLLFGSGEIQYWNDYETQGEQEKNHNTPYEK